MRKTLTENELWFLLTLFAPSLVIGFRNPTAGLLRDEILTLRKKLSEELVTKKIIQREKNDVKIIAPLHSYCWQMTHAEKVLLITLKIENESTTTLAVYPASDQIVVSMTSQGVSEYEVFSASQEEILAMITGVTREASDVSPVGSAWFNVEQEKVIRAHRFIEEDKVDEAVNLVRNTSFALLWEQYVDTIKKPAITCALVEFFNLQSISDMYTAGFSFVLEKKNCWIVEPSGEDPQLASIRKTSIHAIQQRIQNALSM